MAKLNDFIALTKQGLMRTNRYEVVVPFPKGGTGLMKKATLFCDSVTIPGVNVASTQSRVFGEAREMPYERTFEPVQLSFYCDLELEIKKAFESWINLIINPQTRIISYYASYIKDVKIYIQTPNDSATQVITLYEAYPKTLQSIQMDAGGKDLMKMNVTLQYKYWTSESTTITPDSNNLSIESGSPSKISSSETGDPAGTTTGTGTPPPTADGTSAPPANDFGYNGGKP